jgi:ribosome assembly protein YihI (activator of Der GTPase)
VINKKKKKDAVRTNTKDSVKSRNTHTETSHQQPQSLRQKRRKRRGERPPIVSTRQASNQTKSKTAEKKRDEVVD